MTPEAASALCLANNRDNVANMVLLRGNGEVSWGWFASRIQLSADAPAITISPRPERPEQVAPFTLDLEATTAVKVELSSGGDHYFGDRQALLGVELPMKLRAIAHCIATGEIARAVSLADAALELCDAVDDAALATCVRGSAGEVYRMAGRAGDAERVLVAAVDGAREVLDESDPNRAQTIENLGSLRLDQGKAAEAGALFAEVVALRETGDPMALAQGLCSLGLARTRLGELDAAIAASRRALELAAGSTTRCAGAPPTTSA